MYGFNRSGAPVGHRPPDPLAFLSFEEWWFHGHIDYPPHKEDVFQFVAGEKAMLEHACDKGVTSYWNSSHDGDARDPTNPDYPCPRRPTSQFHTTGIDDVKGCALAVAYKSDVKELQPEDFTVFSVNQTCVWHLHTYYEVPAAMPKCPPGGCHCVWGWVHSPDSGSEQSWFLHLSNPEMDHVH
jgi:hypothetical protein